MGDSSRNPLAAVEGIPSVRLLNGHSVSFRPRLRPPSPQPRHAATNMADALMDMSGPDLPKPRVPSKEEVGRRRLQRARLAGFPRNRRNRGGRRREAVSNAKRLRSCTVGAVAAATFFGRCRQGFLMTKLLWTLARQDCLTAQLLLVLAITVRRSCSSCGRPSYWNAGRARAIPGSLWQPVLAERESYRALPGGVS